MKPSWVAVIAIVTACAGGCASPSPSVYSQYEAMRIAEVREGIVVGMRPVAISGDQSPVVGAGVGAVVGGLLGNAVLGGHAGGTILGALAGGVGGAAIEQQGTRQQGEEITVRLDGGQTVAVVQQAGEGIRPGDRVRLITDSSHTRVERV